MDGAATVKVLVAVITELWVAPAVIVRDVGFAVRLKSGVEETNGDTELTFCKTFIDVAPVDGVETNINEISANRTMIFPGERISFNLFRYGRLGE